MADVFFVSGGTSRRWLSPLLALLPLLSVAQAPTVVRSGLAPAANARTAARTTTVAVPFSQAIDPATASGIRIHSAQYRGQRTATAAASGPAVTLTPTVPAGGSPATAFRPGETVQVSVPPTVRGTTGTAAAPYVYQFTTAVYGGTGNFAGGSTSVVSNSPVGVVVGDVDSDGDLDLLTANNNDNNVSVRLNDGRGNFTAPAINPNPAVDPTPAGIVLGDVDGDGDLDFVTVNITSANLSVRLNNGTGNFTVPAVNPNPAVGSSPRNLTLGDVDGDGDLDVAVANHFGDDVSIRFNDGAGSFTASASSPNPAVGLFPAGLALGDVDGDGDLDLVVVSNGSSTVSVRLNDGRGSFAASAALPDVAVGANPEKVALGDVDGDGDLDFVTANNRGDNVSVRLNNGTGSFTPPSTNADLAVGGYPDDIVLGDVDGDGDLDLLTANFDFNSSSVSVRLNNGLGSFTPPLTNPDPVSVAGSANASLALGDMDGDGDLDFVTASFTSPSTACIRLNNGTTLATASTALAARAAVHPNPAHGSFTLLLPAVANAAPVTATLLNALGQVVSTRVLPLAAGGTTAEYSTAALAAGVYALRLQAGPETATLRVVVE